MRETVDTTYADLRPSDLVIDKSGQAWPIAELVFASLPGQPAGNVIFWLCDPVTKVKMHNMFKVAKDPVKVARLPTQADEASKLEAEMPAVPWPFDEKTQTIVSEKLAEIIDKPFDEALIRGDNFATMAEAVAAVEEIGGTVEAEVTAAEVDAAAAATDDAPLTIIPFADMTPLEARSHLYLLHGCYSHDMQSRDTLSTWHNELHSPENTVKSKTVPHAHAASTDVKSRG